MPPPEFLLRAARRLRPPALLRRAARRLGPPAFLLRAARRLGPPEFLRRAARRLGPPEFLLRAARRLGPRQRAGIIALATAATALGMGAASSHQDAEPAAKPKAAAPRDDDVRLLPGGTASIDRLAASHRRGPRRGGAEYYRRTSRKRVVPKGARAFLPLYREAERQYAVNWRLIASIHRQETAFSTASTTYHGLNDYGCCAGPMQFNVTNGPVSTWERYRNAYRKGHRPKSYPHRTRKHPSIYDDFDAIMAAGSLLAASGAGPSLDSAAWTAAYAYYGHDLYGLTYASQVLARAVGWQRDGFCPNCAVDEGLAAKFDERYGEPIRSQLMSAERREQKLEKDKKRKKRARDRKAKLEERHRRARRRFDEKNRSRSRSRRRRPSRPRKTRPAPPRARRPGTKPAKPRPTPAPPSTPPPTTTPAPPPRECAPLSKLLGCR